MNQREIRATGQRPLPAGAHLGRSSAVLPPQRASTRIQTLPFEAKHSSHGRHAIRTLLQPPLPLLAPTPSSALSRPRPTPKAEPQPAPRNPEHYLNTRSTALQQISRILVVPPTRPSAAIAVNPLRTVSQTQISFVSTFLCFSRTSVTPGTLFGAACHRERYCRPPPYAAAPTSTTSLHRGEPLSLVASLAGSPLGAGAPEALNPLSSAPSHRWQPRRRPRHTCARHGAPST